MRAVEDVVAEVDIPADASDTSFEQFLQRNQDCLNRVVDENRLQFGYVFLFIPPRLYRQFYICTLQIENRKNVPVYIFQICSCYGAHVGGVFERSG